MSRSSSHELLERAEPTVLCTHRPVLPYVYDALGVADPELEPGAMLVVHHRKRAGRRGRSSTAL